MTLRPVSEPFAIGLFSMIEVLLGGSNSQVKLCWHEKLSKGFSMKNCIWNDSAGKKSRSFWTGQRLADELKEWPVPKDQRRKTLLSGMGRGSAPSACKLYTEIIDPDLAARADPFTFCFSCIE